MSLGGGGIESIQNKNEKEKQMAGYMREREARQKKTWIGYEAGGYGGLLSAAALAVAQRRRDEL